MQMRVLFHVTAWAEYFFKDLNISFKCMHRSGGTIYVKLDFKKIPEIFKFIFKTKEVSKIF
jgi:hypothetical protein